MIWIIWLWNSDSRKYARRPIPLIDIFHICIIYLSICMYICIIASDLNFLLLQCSAVQCLILLNMKFSFVPVAKKSGKLEGHAEIDKIFKYCIIIFYYSETYTVFFGVQLNINTYENPETSCIICSWKYYKQY